MGCRQLWTAPRPAAAERGYLLHWAEPSEQHTLNLQMVDGSCCRASWYMDEEVIESGECRRPHGCRGGSLRASVPGALDVCAMPTLELEQDIMLIQY